MLSEFNAAALINNKVKEKTPSGPCPRREGAQLQEKETGWYCLYIKFTN